MKIAYEADITKHVTVGRFTIVEVTTEKGIRGIGVARRSQGDLEKKDVGKNIAYSRAIKAIQHKLNKKQLHNPLMG